MNKKNNDIVGMYNKNDVKTKVIMDADCIFLKELEESSTRARYNLITSIGALKLWNKGIKPSRHWKIGVVKKYFGLNGNKKVLLEKLKTIDKILKGEI